MRGVPCLQILRFLIVATITVGIGLYNGNLSVSACKQSEKQSLLMLKKDLEDPSNRLSSWIADDEYSDCCNWTGVVCDDLTGHIHELHLGNPDGYYSDPNSSLVGKINPSLLNLTHLTFLNLSNNDFQGTQIPTFFGSLKSLTHLDLSYANFQGSIPHQLGNLSSLRDLRLNGFWVEGPRVENFQWISALSQLKHLDMSEVNVSKASDWLQVTNMLPSLEELHLSYCGLQHIPSLTVTNFTSLAILDLSYNTFSSLMPRWVVSLRNIVSLNLHGCDFQGPIPSSPNNITSLQEIDFSYNNLNISLPEWLFNQKDLAHLNLARNTLQGLLPEGFSNMTALKSVDLSENNFSGDISELFERLFVRALYNLEFLGLGYNNFSGHLTPQIGSFKKLSHLDLSTNQLGGSLPAEIIGHLKMLTYLDISDNSFEDVVSEVHFTHLTRLESFIAAGNSFTLKTHRGWVPPFQLRKLYLDSWNLVPEFPIWLQNQRNLEYLSLSNTGISGTIPNWFWYSQFSYLNLSNNRLYGEIDYIDGDYMVDLSHNQFTGSLPVVSVGIQLLDLSNSSFSGSVSHFFCDSHHVYRLYLRNNLLSGNIPDCWMYWQNLMVLDLGSNNLTGSIPSSIGHLLELQSLQLGNNHLSGELPISMQNCTSLVVLNLGQNKFSGRLPTWLGKSLSSLVVLSFRSNKFEGDIPDQLCNLTNLQILDLAHNNISGTLPTCFGNLTAMVNLLRPDGELVLSGYEFGRTTAVLYMDSVFLITKGRELEYSSILGYVTSMDLSGNIISGNVPEELTNLLSLQTLNLSENHLTGRIPSKIGNMVKLETVDLSLNKLFGEIPSSMASLTFLNHLNLSYNNLTGQIPLSTQLQSLDQSSFIGNDLCGPPLAKNCSAGNVIPPNFDQQDKGYDIFEDQWFYLSLGLGFMFGFWTIFGSLLVNLPWSLAFSQFLNSLVLKVHAVIVKYV